MGMVRHALGQFFIYLNPGNYLDARRFTHDDGSERHVTAYERNILTGEHKELRRVRASVIAPDGHVRAPMKVDSLKKVALNPRARESRGRRHPRRPPRRACRVLLFQIFDNHYHFHHNSVSKRSTAPAHEHHDRLEGDSRVRWAKQQRALSRKKRDFLSEDHSTVPHAEATPSAPAPSTASRRAAGRREAPARVKGRPRAADSKFQLNDPKWPHMWYLMNDDLREGRPSTATTEGNISAVWLMIETDKRVTYKKIRSNLAIGIN
ncbi:Furin-like protease 1, isoform 1-CRR [Eumeta japonica]|uniref:Furin-like protease 1, isoform 1-CRR n=1 Tax=Eumeta variegata TaxID=151549 RepID=A0A4C1UMI4_EUMVA|nr:Furin-like protease 1, isoform 1-CRR [Eumeta japonica]